MRPQDAEFTVGDWEKPHTLTGVGVKDHPDLRCVSCSCGWGVMTGSDMADKLGKIHLDRAKEKQRS